MNAQQRRKYRRSKPRPTSCFLQGYSGGTSYPDLMCQDGYMRDMDDDGYDPSTWAPPCKNCNTVEYAEWLKELDDDEVDFSASVDESKK
ncbi:MULTISPECIES: hypothetical protein [unclassified Janthinobacterium]|uniref:hypothetical protein n=1 Tax=unclassified Janthinobacterium TaxID=2610881 RepID=UPI00160E9BC7|nr:MULTISPECIES: hypothetical protein [unclassified Janthinobacterium]MBB5610597.1 hypothetical protein [Janthinobacterium sp. S3T4]MBB5615949.1 hypothetical protein [Janthinobacterium sp. S3M3]